MYQMMVKAVSGDEIRLQSAEDRLTRSSLQSQVGLVIGKHSSSLDKGFVYDLVPTPPNDAGEPPCSIIGEINRNVKKNSAKPKSLTDSSSALSIDKDWVAEHARQVSRMLLGGMMVIGIYIWVNESLFKNSTITLCQTVKGVAEAASSVMTDCIFRWTCRICSLAANITSSTLRPCDFKMGNVLGSLQTFRCTYNFDIRLPMTHEDGLDVKKFANVLRDRITIHGKELIGAKALINGKLVIAGELCVLDDFNEVEFLLPLMQDKYVEACSQKKVLGVLLLSGSVCSLSYLNSKEPVSQALDDIKDDIIRSLLSRVEIICDEAQSELEPAANGDPGANTQMPSGKHPSHLDLQVLMYKSASSRDFVLQIIQRKLFQQLRFSVLYDECVENKLILGKIMVVSSYEASQAQGEKVYILLPKVKCNLSFPRRVFVPWLEGTYICDYIQPSETTEIVKDHCSELVAIEIPEDASEIMEPELEGSTVIASTVRTFWGIANDYSSDAKPDNSASKVRGDSNLKPTKAADFKPLAAVLVLILSIIVGLVLYVINTL